MLSTDSGFSEEVYLAAAQEHMTLANHLLEPPPRYVFACYVAGVAVECLFHAYRMRLGVNDTAKHDLRRLAELADFSAVVPRKQRERIDAALTEVVTRWRNNHRYRSEDALRRFVTEHRLFVVSKSQTTRQDALQYNAEQLVNAASEIVTLGVQQWKSKS